MKYITFKGLGIASKHSNRFPGRWGVVSGGVSVKNAAGIRHFDDIMMGLGEFVKEGATFVKRLADGRGMRVSKDGTFIGFLDPIK